MKNSKIIKFDDIQNSYSNKERSYDILEEACNVSSKSKAKKLARQALDIYPDNFDAELFLLDFEEDQIKKLSKLNEALNRASDLLEKGGWFAKEYLGDFWLIYETRPYMRVRYRRMQTLVNINRYTEAIKECEEMLKLCKSDNLGVRYTLMELYCIIEDYKKCEKLLKKYEENSPTILLLKSIYLFKIGKYDESKELIRKLKKINPLVIHMALHYEENCLHKYISQKFLEDENIDYYIEDAIYIVTDRKSVV